MTTKGELKYKITKNKNFKTMNNEEFKTFQKIVARASALVLAFGVAFVLFLLASCQKPPLVYRITVKLQNRQVVDFYAQSDKQYYFPGDVFYYQVVYLEGRGCIYWGDVGDLEGLVLAVDSSYEAMAPSLIEYEPSGFTESAEPPEGTMRTLAEEITVRGQEIYIGGQWRPLNAKPK